MTRVLNRRTATRDELRGAIYVGRPSKWGNPFVIGRDGDRATVLQQFRHWVYAPEQEALRQAAQQELRGADLSCWCVPQDCHALVWRDIANS